MVVVVRMFEEKSSKLRRYSFGGHTAVSAQYIAQQSQFFRRPTRTNQQSEPEHDYNYGHRFSLRH